MLVVRMNHSTDHTPGPWEHGQEFKPGRYGLQDVISVSATGEVIAHVNCGFGRGEQHARLIAAAPELLDALRDLVASVQPFAHHTAYAESIGVQYDAARAAIAKAVQS